MSTDTPHADNGVKQTAQNALPVPSEAEDVSPPAKLSHLQRNLPSIQLRQPVDFLAGIAAKGQEDLVKWVKDSPDDAAKMLSDLVLAQQFSNIMLDINAALMEHTATNKIIATILQFAAQLIHCERCSVFLYDKESDELISQVFDIGKGGKIKSSGEEGADAPEADNEGEEEQSFRFSAARGVAGFVARNGKTLIIPDAYQDARFNKEIDLKTGFHTRNILCTPIFDNNHDVMAVTQLVNKAGGAFTEKDAETFDIFAGYCGLALHNARLHERVQKDARQRQVALEMISYHTRAHPSEIEALNTQKLPPKLSLQLKSIVFDPLSIDNDTTLIAARAMFTDSGLAQHFRIRPDVLSAWLLCVKRTYRDVRYHNWRHAFNVGQFIYGLLSSSSVAEYFSPLQKLGFLVAALSHDLDHRGTNNAFEQKYETALGSLYSSSTLEMHHFDTAVAILSTEGHNLLETVPEDSYKEVIHFIKEAILATDLSKHFGDRKRYKELVEGRGFDKENIAHMDLLRSILMTSADLSAVTKPFPAQQRVAELVYSEFFEQGDLERALGTKSEDLQDLMNRQKLNELPKMQLGFIDFVAGPVYDTLGDQFEDLKVLPKEVKRNRADWLAKKDAGPYDFITPLEVLTAMTKSAVVSELHKRDKTVPNGATEIDLTKI